MNRTAERIFQLADLPIIPGTHRPGVLTLATSECPLLRQSGVARLACWSDGTWVVHRPSRTPLRRARETRGHLGVLGLTVQPAGPVTDTTRLALRFAEHLGAVRARSRLIGPFVTSACPDPPDPSPAQVRLFHFVTVHTGESLVDKLVWEWIDRADAEAWFGGPLPNLRPLEQNLSALLALRRAARDHQLPTTPDGDALAHALAGRYFSGRFVLDHYHLIRRLLAGPPDPEDPL